MMTYEHTGTATNSEMVTIGHATCPKTQLRRMIWRAIIKKLFAKANIMPSKWETSIAGVATDTVIFYYRADNQPATGISSITYTHNGTNDMEAIAASFYDNATIKAFTSNVKFEKIGFYPDNKNPGRTELRLSGAKFSFRVESDFRFQNQSVVDLTDNVDAVDTVKLIGKQFDGYGNGTDRIGTQQGEYVICAGDLSGVIYSIPNGDSVREPMPAFLYNNTKKEAGIHVEPGETRTSKITWTRTIGIDQLAEKLYPDSAISDEYVSLGKHRFFQLEKLIDNGVADITTKFEHNMRFGCYVKEGSLGITLPYFAQN